MRLSLVFGSSKLNQDLSFPDALSHNGETGDPLPLPDGWRQHLDMLDEMGLPPPRNVHSLDKAVAWVTLLDEVQFDLNTLQVTCRFHNDYTTTLSLPGRYAAQLQAIPHAYARAKRQHVAKHAAFVAETCRLRAAWMAYDDYPTAVVAPIRRLPHSHSASASSPSLPLPLPLPLLSVKPALKRRNKLIKVKRLSGGASSEHTSSPPTSPSSTISAFTTSTSTTSTSTTGTSTINARGTLTPTTARPHLRPYHHHHPYPRPLAPPPHTIPAPPLPAWFRRTSRPLVIDIYRIVVIPHLSRLFWNRGARAAAGVDFGHGDGYPVGVMGGVMGGEEEQEEEQEEQEQRRKKKRSGGVQREIRTMLERVSRMGPHYPLWTVRSVIAQLEDKMGYTPWSPSHSLSPSLSPRKSLSAAAPPPLVHSRSTSTSTSSYSYTSSSSAEWDDDDGDDEGGETSGVSEVSEVEVDVEEVVSSSCESGESLVKTPPASPGSVSMAASCACSCMVNNNNNKNNNGNGNAKKAICGACAAGCTPSLSPSPSPSLSLSPLPSPSRNVLTKPRPRTSTSNLTTSTVSTTTKKTSQPPQPPRSLLPPVDPSLRIAHAHFSRYLPTLERCAREEAIEELVINESLAGWKRPAPAAAAVQMQGNGQERGHGQERGYGHGRGDMHGHGNGHGYGYGEMQGVNANERYPLPEEVDVVQEQLVMQERRCFSSSVSSSSTGMRWGSSPLVRFGFVGREEVVRLGGGWGERDESRRDFDVGSGYGSGSVGGLRAGAGDGAGAGAGVGGTARWEVFPGGSSDPSSSSTSGSGSVSVSGSGSGPPSGSGWGSGSGSGSADATTYFMSSPDGATTTSPSPSPFASAATSSSNNNNNNNTSGNNERSRKVALRAQEGVDVIETVRRRVGGSSASSPEEPSPITPTTLLAPVPVPVPIIPTVSTAATTTTTTHAQIPPTSLPLPLPVPSATAAACASEAIPPAVPPRSPSRRGGGGVAAASSSIAPIVIPTFALAPPVSVSEVVMIRAPCHSHAAGAEKQQEQEQEQGREQEQMHGLRNGVSSSRPLPLLPPMPMPPRHRELERVWAIGVS